MRITILIIMLALPLKSISGETASCAPGNLAFKPGERIEYSVYYNWGPIWVNAAMVYFKVHEKTYRNRQVYHFDSYGQTLRKFDWLFKVRDRFQSYVDMESFRPLWFEMDTYEGGYVARDVYDYFPGNNTVIARTGNSDRPEQTDTIRIEPCSFDVITAVYFARNLDFSSYRINEAIPLSILMGNEIHMLSPRYLGEETIETREGEKFDCIKFSVELVAGFIFTAGNEMFVWVTNDDNRVPVLIEAQIRIGSVKAMLKSSEGLKNPQTARIEPQEASR
jgi:hypothetical protein